MTTSVLSPEYIQLQEMIAELYEKWMHTLTEQKIVIKERIDMKYYPILPQLNIQINVKDYRSFVHELSTLIKEKKPELKETITKIEALLDDAMAEKWFKEAIIVNSYYFTKFSEENNLPEWLVLFTAEHAARPYIQKAASELSEKFTVSGHIGGCPICGEPSRLAIINQKGKKEVTCPRCHYAWEEKKISCAHCGTEEQGQVVILRINDGETSDIYACKSCKGYTKVIDMRKLVNVPSPNLLDLHSIHLDYIAQENGYGEPKFHYI
ncbi:formate dehydrogenase accessory protein FdhE [Niallia oryzisoli]|uniref:formate dehydrogenase accessory protein FdhE n=1 Tax=Niallia oryzisoli TaxID=1737571 RepID=UPI0037355FDB